MSQVILFRILNEDERHPYYLHRMRQWSQTIIFHVSILFAHIYSRLQPIKHSLQMFYDANFKLSGIFNIHNSHLRAHDNPHGTITHSYQERFSINVWAGIVHINLIGPYILPSHLTGHTYDIFLQKILPEILVDVPPAFSRRMWFQHDEARKRFCRNVRIYLDYQYWTGQGNQFLATAPCCLRVNLFGFLLLGSY